MNHRRLLSFFSVLAIGFGLYTCKVDDELYRLQKTSWAPNMIVPLVDAQLSIEQVLLNGEQSSLQIDPDDRIILNYDAVLYSKSGAEILQFIEKQWALLPDVNILQLDVLPDFVLEELLLKDGVFRLHLEDLNRTEFDRVDVSISGLIINGVPFERSYADASSLEKPISLKGASIDFLPDQNNNISANFEVFNEQGQNITSGFSLILEFRSLILQKVKGWFDEFSISMSKDTIELDLFKRWKSGVVYLDDPHAEFSFQNSFGLPLFASLSTFNAYENGVGSTVVPINYSTPVEDGFAIRYPTSDEVEGIVNSTFELNESNSDISNLIQISPEFIEYDLNLVAQHDLAIEEAGEISDTSRLNILTRVALPLTGRLDHIVARDTFKVVASLPKEVKKVKGAAVNIHSENKLPLEANVQCFLLDADRNLIDSLLLDQRLLNAAIVNDEGKPVEASRHETRIELSQETIDRLPELSFIAIRTKLVSSNSGTKTISVYADNFLGIRLTLEAKYEVL